MACLVLLGLPLAAGCEPEPPPEPPPPTPADIQIQINELASSGTDPVELYNQGDEAVDLAGWYLTDDIDHGVNGALYDPASKEGELVFAPGTLIAPGGYLVIHKGVGVGMHPFGLSGDGETVSLLNQDLAMVDQVTYGAGDGEISYCRVAGEWALCEPTFGRENRGRNCGNGQLDEGERCDGDAGLTTCEALGGFTGGRLACAADCKQFETSACERPAAPACEHLGLRLNEVCHKDSKCGVEGVTQGDWLEIYNAAAEAADVSGCYLRIFETTGALRRGSTQLASIRGLEFASVPGGGYLVLDNNKAIVDLADGSVAELLGSDGETLVNGLTASSAYRAEGEACSIDEDGDVPTPGAENVCQDD